jgi:serine/threonine protein kinase
VPESAAHADTERPKAARPSHWPLPSAVRLGSLPENSDQELRFVQDRIALLGKITFFISTMFLIVTLGTDLLRHTSRMGPIGRTGHVLGTLVALGLWLLLRGRKSYEPRALLAFDALGTLSICVAFVVMGHYSIQPYGYYTGMLSVTHVSITRAMIVPSLPRRTLYLAMASFVGFLVMRATLPLTSDMLQMGSRGRGILEAFLWSTAGTTVATVASQVIYGLHEKAREALQLGQYSLEEKIGEGGMGEIYRAHHAMLRRPTAVKLLLGDGSEAQLKRFEKEVQLTARLTHPNTISIYDYGRTPDGLFYYAMELLDGLTLEQLVERYGPLPPGRVIHLLRQVCGALSEAHGVGLIHRDIKPANIFVCRRGDIPDFVKVLDFGLVRELRQDQASSHSTLNAVVGTPLYMPPEAIVSPNGVDARADLYGLGGVAYFLATGAPPFAGQTVVEVCAHHLHSQPAPPSERGSVPPDLEAIILACLAKLPEARPQSARQLAEALAGCGAANSWQTSDAEAWWKSVGTAEASQAQRPATSGSGEQVRRTIKRADLDPRLSADNKSA